MAKVEQKHPNEKFEGLFRRFKRACEKDDTVLESRKRSQFETPSSKRNRKKAAAKKREQKRVQNTEINRKRMY
jgi:small subunit ribosomal protein S21